MAENSSIQWCHHTFNPWWGCTKVSQGCQHCYAESLSNRFGHQIWGPEGTRRMMEYSYWRKPLLWDKKAAKAGGRHRVFCASMADVFEAHRNPTEMGRLDSARARLWELIEQTPNLDWLLLTKRPENIQDMVPAHWLEIPRHNVWYGTSVESQEWADKRIPALLSVPAAVRFLSCEPLLGPVDLWSYTAPQFAADDPRYYPWHDGVEWVIIGGESGPKARPMYLRWASDIVHQCWVPDIPVFIKQLGSVWARKAIARDSKGGDLDEWPPEFRIRQFPEVKILGTPEERVEGRWVR